jgi:diaminopimelate decarboxylase
MASTRDASGGGLSFGFGANPLEALEQVIREAGTPCYAYDLDGIAAAARSLEEAFEGAPHLICYAVKANSAGAVVRAIAAQGCGADVVSGAELRVALACGIEPDRIVYSGVAKRDEEIDQAIACGGRGIGALQIESLEEIARLQARAVAAGRKLRVGVRVNPSVDQAEVTHAHIATGHDEAKFGVPLEDALDAARIVAASPNLELVGMGVHAGSQFTSLEPYLEAARVLFGLVSEMRAPGAFPSLAFVDTGGGFGVDYGDGMTLSPADFVRAARAEQRSSGLGNLSLYVEPGRSLVAAHGVLLARVIQAKVTDGARWLMIDAGMNDFLRPALYQARHRIVPLDRDAADVESVAWRVVGPVCESSDDFGEHLLPREPPEAVAILDAGAYGYTMASEYNGRQLPVEAFVRGGRIVSRTQRRSVDEWVEERARAGS